MLDPLNHLVPTHATALAHGAAAALDPTLATLACTVGLTVIAVTSLWSAGRLVAALSPASLAVPGRTQAPDLGASSRA